MREKFQICIAKFDSGKHKLSTRILNRIFPLWEQRIEDIVFWTENVARTTKFLRFFACLEFFDLYANFNFILMNNILIIAHLNI